jgi:hypothetical protein
MPDLTEQKTWIVTCTATLDATHETTHIAAIPWASSANQNNPWTTTWMETQTATRMITDRVMRDVTRTITQIRAQVVLENVIW